MSEKTTKAVASRKSRPVSDRRARKAAMLRQRLIDCALAQFEKSGFTRASIDSITEAADVGKGTFYNYFDSKESLLAAWGRELLREADKDLADAPVAGEPALRRLFRLFNALLEPVQKRPGLARPFVLAHLLMAPDHPSIVRNPSSNGHETPEEGPPNVLAMALPIVQMALKQKAIRSDLGAETLAKTFVGVFYQSVMLLATGEETGSPLEHLRAGLAVALEGLAPAVE